MEQVLMVVDMQRDFVSGPLGTPEARLAAVVAAERIAGFNGTIVATMDTHGYDQAQTVESAMLPPHCICGSCGWQLDPGIADALAPKRCIYVEKHSFANMAAVDAVRAAAAGRPVSVELMGVCTDVCVISMALLLRSCMPDADLWVNASCCAGTAPQRHRAALAVMRSCLIGVMDSPEEDEHAL